MEVDGIQLDFLGELRDVKHFLFRLADVAVNEVPVQIKVVLCQDLKGIADLLLGNAFLKLLQDPVVRRLDPEQEDPKARFLGLGEDMRVPGNVNPGLDSEDFPDIVLDNQIAKLFASLEIGEDIVVAEHYDVGGNHLEFFDDRLKGAFRVAALLAERVEAERAELAFVWAAPGGQDGIERVPAESSTALGPAVIVCPQRPVGKRNVREVWKLLVFVVDDVSVLSIGEPANVPARDPRDDLLDDLLALAAHDHIDIRTTLE